MKRIPSSSGCMALVFFLFNVETQDEIKARGQAVYAPFIAHSGGVSSEAAVKKKLFFFYFLFFLVLLYTHRIRYSVRYAILTDFQLFQFSIFF